MFNQSKIEQYKYKPDEALEALGLDEELLHNLLVSYVEQVIDSIAVFLEYLSVLENTAQKDFVPLRDLAHKNLGVARNLHVKDAEFYLNEIMKSEDLVYLRECVKSLSYSSIKLKRMLDVS